MLQQLPHFEVIRFNPNPPPPPLPHLSLPDVVSLRQLFAASYKKRTNSNRFTVSLKMEQSYTWNNYLKWPYGVYLMFKPIIQ